MRRDGWPGFGAFSSSALEILEAVAQECDGFCFSDDGGTAWAARFDDETKDLDGPVYAASYEKAASILDPAFREDQMRALAAWLARCRRPGRRWDAEDRMEYARWSHAWERLQALEQALELLAGIYQTVALRSGSVLEIQVPDYHAAVGCRTNSAAADFGMERMPGTLLAAMRLQFAEIRLCRTGWDPLFVGVSPAVAGVEQGDGILRVHLGRLFYAACERFSGHAKSPDIAGGGIFNGRVPSRMFCQSTTLG